MIAISTAFKQALIAIEIDGQTNFESLDSNCKHSENMLFAIDKMLDEMDKSIKDNQHFAVVVGPGSFTGIRIGISLVKGLCAGSHDKRVIPFTTFDLMAYSYIKNFKPEESFSCIINGLSGYYFICEYSRQGEKLCNEKMVTQQDIASMNNLVGLAEEKLGDNQVSPTPQHLLELANKKIQENQTIESKDLTALYLRKSQAESSIDEKNLKKKLV